MNLVHEIGQTYYGMLYTNTVVYDVLRARIDVIVDASRVLPDDANLPLDTTFRSGEG
jgi:hypothetical protein